MLRFGNSPTGRTSPAGHPKEHDGVLEDIEGTGKDSLHFLSPAAPDPAGTVVHPDGYKVPSGRIQPRASGRGSSATDEIVVYDASQCSVRYLIELRDVANLANFKEAPKEESESTKAGAPDTDATMGTNDEEEEEEEEDEDEEDEEEDSE